MFRLCLEFDLVAHFSICDKFRYLRRVDNLEEENKILSDFNKGYNLESMSEILDCCKFNVFAITDFCNLQNSINFFFFCFMVF